MESFSSLNKYYLFGVLVIICITCKNTDCKTFEDDVFLSFEQKKLLDQFRDRVELRLPHDYMKEDIYLIKWLRNQEFDVKAAESKLMTHLEWRQELRMDTIHEEDWSDMTEFFQYYLEGRDKFSRPILYFDLGTMDLRRALIRGQGGRLLRYVAKAVDESCDLVQVLGNKYKNITRGHLIVNLEGYNLVQHGCLRCIPFILTLIPSYEDHYPEYVDQIVLLNTPAIIDSLLNLIIPLLSRETKESLRIYGTNKRKWKEVLSKDFDFAQLPPAIGGTMVYKGMDTDYY